MTDGTGTTTYTPDAMGDVTSQAFSAAQAAAGSARTRSATATSRPVSSPRRTSPLTGTTSARRRSPTPTTPSATWPRRPTGSATRSASSMTAMATSRPRTTRCRARTRTGRAARPTPTTAPTSTPPPPSSLAQTCGGQESLTQSFAGSGGSRNADGEVTEDTETYTGSCSGQGSYERNYSYDLAGQVVYQGSAPQGSSANNFAYSPAGVPTEISSHVSSGGNFDTYSQTNNSAEAVTTQTLIAGTGGVSTTYGYDSIGDLTSSTSRGRRRTTAMTRSAR